jgi:multisubunit Na+/H+ antiporter MnhB subunit
VQVAARALPGFGVLLGIYLVWAGSSAPGGKFQGAAVLAAMWILVLLAGLRRPPHVADRRIRALLAAGPALFLALGGVGMVAADGFLAWPDGFAKPLILGVEAALTVSVAVALGLLVAGPPVRAP